MATSNAQMLLPVTVMLPLEALSGLHSNKVTVGNNKNIKDFLYIYYTLVYSFLDGLLPVTCYLQKWRRQGFTRLQSCVYNALTMTTKTPSKNGKFLGRPTKYDPAYCEQVVELGKLGKSREQICATLHIGVHNMNTWEQAHEEFRRAIEESRLYALAYWEDIADRHMTEVPGGPRLNTGLWARSMSARFPAKYSDRTKVEVTGKDGGAIEVDHVHDFSKALLDDLLNTRQSDAKS